MRKRIAITMGDAAGIGAEITVKALSSSEVYEKAIPVVYGDRAPLEDALSFCKLDGLKLKAIESWDEAVGEYGVIEFFDAGLLAPGAWEYKKNQAVSGDASFQYIIAAIRDAMDKKCDAVVTGPISKEAIHMAGHNYSGHTEIFADYTNTHKYSMLLSGGNLRVIHVTTHVSMEQACKLITMERELDVIRLAKRGMALLGYENPRIAVAGFNAHCSENGLFGNQEALAIEPAVHAAQAEGICVDGPIPPDTVFCKALGGMYDIVVAQYHDQGHIPIKLQGFRLDPKTNMYTSMSGINCTIGLPIIRTSVDHGTAYGKAGEGRANEESMRDAIDAAITMANHF
ncbi:MAG: 4-hydroxythreonine-4-phosphate dehydrogenase PdxA [Clostridia bacterium]|nr:4-hydroxythreonine-4-phosphate dehydrogenase PdxA [Clostridia bacterium]